jgi:hypothetical protein
VSGVCAVRDVWLRSETVTAAGLRQHDSDQPGHDAALFHWIPLPRYLSSSVLRAAVRDHTGLTFTPYAHLQTPWALLCATAAVCLSVCLPTGL